MSSETLHVPRDKLSAPVRMLHHAIVSLQEELDAVDWYRQRAEDTEDDELRSILLHNMREEMEHACMLIEWIRRNNADFAGHLSTYLYSEGPLLAVEAKAGKGAKPDGSPPGRGFIVGSLKGE
jgi:uncharacterized protein